MERTIKPGSSIPAVYTDYFKIKTQSIFESKRLPRVIQRYGGKGRFFNDYEVFIRKLAEQQRANNPTNINVFVDCFGGGGTMSIFALLMIDTYTFRPLFDSVIYNDFDIGIYSVFKVVSKKDTCEELVDRLLKTEYSKEAWVEAHECMARVNQAETVKRVLETDPGNRSIEDVNEYMKLMKLMDGDEYTDRATIDARQNSLLNDLFSYRNQLSDVDLAYYYYIESFFSFNSAGNSFRDYLNGFSCRIDYEHLFHKEAVALLEMPEILKGLIVQNKSYDELITELLKYQNANYTFFLDPPYLPEERTESATEVYTKELSTEDHRSLMSILSSLRYWILCGYDQNEGGNSVYGQLMRVSNPEVERISLGVKYRTSSSKGLRRDDPEEIIWVRK